MNAYGIFCRFKPEVISSASLFLLCHGGARFGSIMLCTRVRILHWRIVRRFTGSRPLSIVTKGKFVNWIAPLSWLSVTTELTKSLIHVSFYVARFPSSAWFWADLIRSVQDSNPRIQYLMIITRYPSHSLESLLTLILVRILLAIWLFLYFTLLWKEHNMRFTCLTKF